MVESHRLPVLDENGDAEVVLHNANDDAFVERLVRISDEGELGEVLAHVDGSVVARAYRVRHGKKGSTVTFAQGEGHRRAGLARAGGTAARR